MNFETIFSGAGTLAMTGWVALLISPWIPTWSERIAGMIIPAILATTYVAIIILLPIENGGFGSFSEVTELFAQPQALMAGWIHFLAFDLLIGAWICRKARQESIPFWLVLPCLPLTFLFGPAGYLAFLIIKSGRYAIHGKPVAST